MPGATPKTPSIDLAKGYGASSGAGLVARRIVLGVSGSIAVYKACELARLLVKRGAEVQVVMTHSAREFVGPATFAGITRRPVCVEMFGESALGETHVSLTSSSDLIVIAPATADLLARLATGRADDLLTAIALCARVPIVVAPAMHPSMWQHPATERNVEQLRSDGRVRFVGPVTGEVASGDVGLGRLADPDTILHAVITALTPQDLAARHVVVSAGPTVEDLDPVRFLGNRSSGKMGFAIAAAAAERGARVTLVAGPTHLPTPAEVTRIDVRSAVSMRAALREALGGNLANADILIMAAAVGDFRFSETHGEKLKRNHDTIPALVMNPDILAEFGAERRGPRPLLVGFAVETNQGSLVQAARHKLASKRVDLVVANLAEESLGRDENHVTLVTENSELQLPGNSKSVLAAQILDFVVSALGVVG